MNVAKEVGVGAVASSPYGIAQYHKILIYPIFYPLQGGYAQSQQGVVDEY